MRSAQVRAARAGPARLQDGAAATAPPIAPRDFGGRAADASRSRLAAAYRRGAETRGCRTMYLCLVGRCAFASPRRRRNWAPRRLGTAAASDGALWASVLRSRGAGRLRRALSGAAPRVCYVGGSISEQKNGWRPRFHGWLDARLRASKRPGAAAVDACCGNAGATLLAFTAADWVVKAAPDVVVIEVAVNDGDAVLEAGGDTDVRRALEGILRGLRDALPDAAVVFVDMFLRADLPPGKRSGTRAWVDATGRDFDAAREIYHGGVGDLHARLAARYDAAHVDLVPFFKRLPGAALDRLFRDDCHHADTGADLAAAAVAWCVESLFGDGAPSVRGPLPRPLDASFWKARAAERFDADPNFLTAAGAPPDGAPRTATDRCPVTGGPGRWHWLFAGDGATCRFDGTALGVLTNVGPDSGALSITIDGGAPMRVDLSDRWCYYWRSTIVVLASGLERGVHKAEIRVLDEAPDRSVLKRPITDANYLDHPHLSITPKLWLMWFVAIGA